MFPSRPGLGLLVLLLSCPLLLRAEDSGCMLDQPGIFFRIVKAIEESEVGSLKPETHKEGGKAYSYHLRSVEYLGYVTHSEKRYYLAEAFFVRSSAKGSDFPPARGHPALLILDAKCRIVGLGADTYVPELSLNGQVLSSGNEVLIDFADTPPRIRHSGWIWGDGKIAYPFSDRISDKEWNSPAYEKERQDPKEQPVEIK